jgi:transketolase
MAGELTEGWDQDLPNFSTDSPKMATRESSGIALNAIASRLPTLIGGSADLASSNNTTLKGLPMYSANDYSGRNIWFGVREFAMGAALNGMSLHGGLRPFGGTFFVFSDYLRPAIRLSALMKQPVIYVLTHDSIAVGEDGPTHEPVEQLPSLRAMPGLIVFRPADANETIEAYRYALSQQESPVAMVLSRHKLPVQEGTAQKARDGVARGAYILAEPANNEQPKALLLATGSEVQLAVEAQQLLAEKGVPVRVVSMPSWELFMKQPQAYRDEVLPPAIERRMAIEMANPLGWERFVGPKGHIVGINEFGASAPGDRIMLEYGFTAENISQLLLNSMREENV